MPAFPKNYWRSKQTALSSRAYRLRPGEEAKNLIEIAGLKNPARTLDLGSGTGYLFAPLRRRLGKKCEIVAADHSRHMLAHSRAEAMRHGIMLISADAEKLGACLGRFDAALACMVLHLADPKKVARSVSGILRPGGKFAFCVPGDWNGKTYAVETAPQKKGLDALLAHFSLPGKKARLENPQYYSKELERLPGLRLLKKRLAVEMLDKQALCNYLGMEHRLNRIVSPLTRKAKKTALKKACRDSRAALFRNVRYYVFAKK